MRINILILLILVIGCRNASKNSHEQTSGTLKIQENNCLTVIDRQLILKSILSTEDFQMFLHPNTEGRLPINLVKNEFVTPNLDITSNGRKVVFCDSLTLPDGREHRITIRQLDCKSKSLSYSVFYPVEGVIISGIVNKVNDSWVASETTWGEKD